MTNAFRLALDCDNAAFDGDGCNVEIVRCLRAVADRIEAGDSFGRSRDILDINGNIIGHFVLAPRAPARTPRPPAPVAEFTPDSFEVGKTYKLRNSFSRRVISIDTKRKTARLKVVGGFDRIERVSLTWLANAVIGEETE